MPLSENKHRRKSQAGQSVIIAIIVLFLLLFLGAIFIAIIANNIRNTQRAAITSASGRFAEAGINYLDQQLTNSPDGADWRPVPENTTLTNDPDFFWLKPLALNTATGQYEGGYTRVNFGGPTPGQGNLGGRALVRITYRPDNDTTTAANARAINKFIKLESVGRSGQVDPNDPTTFANTDSLGQRVEQTAYKDINLNGYIRQIDNKDNKPVTATLGAPFPILDRDSRRNIESVYSGPIRVNSALEFYGVNRFVLSDNRSDTIEVAGQIALNGVSQTATALTNTDQTQVYVNSTTPNVFPSTSNAFTTVGGLVRDNPRGAETATLPSNTGDLDAQGNSFRNLRTVGRTNPPLIDAPSGPNGVSRYLQLTRDSSPLAPQYMKQNQFGTTGAGVNVARFAGQIGWGTGLYLPNRSDIQQESSILASATSPRADWLNPGGSAYWKQGDFNYVPPAVTITLTPRYMIITRSPYDTGSAGRQSLFFRDPATGQRITNSQIIRYTGQSGGTNTALATPPSLGLLPNIAAAPKYEGYPAEAPGGTHPNSYAGDYVIYAEGNVRIRGVVGGYDPETKEYFKRHLTVVSGGTIYVDGNLLRDNIDPSLGTAEFTSVAAQEVSKESSIALLAKNYVCVNTTQFLTPADVNSLPDSPGTPLPSHVQIAESRDDYTFRITPGPINDINTTPVYALASPPSTVMPMSVFLRHATSGLAGSQSSINLFVNLHQSTATDPGYNFQNFSTDTPNVNPTPPSVSAATLLLSKSTDALVYVNDRFTLDNNFLIAANKFPFTNNVPTIGQDNFLTLHLDTSSGNPGASTPYFGSRVGVAPLDIRIEALMYAQEGSFFIIPGPWFNPQESDTYSQYISYGPGAYHRVGENAGPGRQQINHFYPFYKEPMDVRITFYGAITENLPAEIADQGAWLEKWGWIPQNYGSTGLTDPSAGSSSYPQPPAAFQTYHGNLPAFPGTTLPNFATAGSGNGIVYQFDPRQIAPYKPGTIQPLRPNPYDTTQPLPITPRLPVAPGLLYYGQSTNLPR